MRLPCWISLLMKSMGVIVITALLVSMSAVYARPGITITGSSTVLPIIRDLAVEYEKITGVTIKVSGGGSSKGLSDIMSGKSNIGMVSRKLTSSEQQKLQATVIAYDGVAVIVHSSNRIKQLGKQQIYDIFQGKLTNWSELGGSNVPISVIVKNKGRATRRVFDRYFGIADISQQAEVVGSNVEMLVLVGINPGAIGYVSIGAVEEAKASGVLIESLPLNSVRPILEHVKDGAYPLSRPLNLVSGKTRNSTVTKFIDFVLSKRGREVVTKHNYIFAH